MVLGKFLEEKDLHARGVASDRSGSQGIPREERHRMILAAACMAEEVVAPVVDAAAAAAGRREYYPNLLRCQRTCYPLVLVGEKAPLLDVVEASVALAAAHTVGDIVDAFEGVEDSSWASYLCLVTMNIQNWLEKDISVGGHEAVECNLPCMGANCGPPIPILIMGGPPG